MSRAGAECHISASRKDLSSTLLGPLLATGTNDRPTMHRAQSHEAMQSQANIANASNVLLVVLPYSYAPKIWSHQPK